MWLIKLQVKVLKGQLREEIHFHTWTNGFDPSQLLKTGRKLRNKGYQNTLLWF